MRILHVSRTMGQGGAEKVVFQLCKDCNQVEHYVASCGGEYVKELEKKGIKHIIIPDIDKKRLDIIVRTLFILLKTAKRYRVDIIHTHHRMAAFYVRLLQILNPRIKHVYTAHNVFYGKRKLMRFALKKAIVVACGNTVKNNLIDEYSISEDRIKVIYNSVERNPIKDVNIDCLNEKERQGAFLIGSVGRISEQKGFDVFVKAIAKCKKSIPSIIGVIIGDGIDRKKIERLVKELGIEDSILFLGYQKDVVSIISKMQFIVLCSRWEGFPLTPIETFSVGKTIIVSDIPNNIEIVNEGINGMIFSKDNYTDLASKILVLFKNRDYKNMLEDGALKKYNSTFDYQAFIEKYMNIYYLCQGRK